MKICNTCNEELEIIEFSIRNANRQTYHNRCKKCTNIYAEEYRNKNKDILKEKQQNGIMKMEKYGKKSMIKIIETKLVLTKETNTIAIKITE